MAFQISLLFAAFFGLMLIRVPVAFALLGSSILLFFFHDRLVPWTVTQRLFFGVDSFVLLAVPLFILTATIMNEAQITGRLIRLAHALVGWISGGLAMVNVAVSMVFAGVSGSSTADTAAVGGILIPQMARRGYEPHFTVGVTASSSVLGMIIPPSITMIIWASLTNTSVAAMFLGGVVPGLLIGLGMLALVYALSKARGYPREERLMYAEVRGALRDSVLAMGVPVVVIGGIILGVVTATEAAVLSVAYSLFLGIYVYRTVLWADVPRILNTTVKLAVLPLFALASASVFSYLLAFHRVPQLVEGVMASVPGVAMLPVIVLMWLIIGTFLDAVPAMIILIPVFAPLVQSLGIDPVQYGVVSVMALALA